jgi:hypothetical protein
MDERQERCCTSVTVTMADIHRLQRRGCKTLMTVNHKSASARCANQNAMLLRQQFTETLWIQQSGIMQSVDFGGLIVPD